jgi:AraC-like DNA-binding protein
MLLVLLKRAGLDVESVLAADGFTISEIENATSLVPLDGIRHLVSALPKEAREGFGLNIGESAPVLMFGPVGLAVTASETLGEALQTLGRYFGKRGRTVQCRYVMSDGYGDVELVELADFGGGRDVSLECNMIVFRKLISAVVGQTLEGLVWQFPYERPAWAPRYAEHFPGTIEFEADACRVRVPRRHLSLRSISADPKIHDAALRECEREAAEVEFDSRRDFVSQVKNSLAGSENDFPKLPSVAASLGVSTRTLMRRLKENRLTYRKLVDEIRAERACWRLTHTKDSVERIAADLGYEDTSNFSRTFYRWRGQTPSSFRRQAQQ